MGRLTKTPYLVLFILLGAVGVTAVSAVALVTIDNLKVTGDTELDGKLLDANDEAGTSGQVLSSTETGIDWVDASGSPSVTYVQKTFAKPGGQLFTTDGLYTAIAIGDDGLPVIAYYANADLYITHCETLSCGSFTTTMLDTVSPAWISIAIGTDPSDKNPIVSYYDTGLGNLNVVHCTNTACTTFDTPKMLDEPNTVGEYSSIAIGTDNNPIISYFEGSPGFNLRTLHCTTPSCSGFSAPSIIDTTGVVGTWTSIAVPADGMPVISYRDDTLGGLKVIKCANTACTFASSTEKVDADSKAGRYTSIAIGNDGLPVMSYFFLSSNDLKLLHCKNADCTMRDAPVVLDKRAFAGEWNDIAIGKDTCPIVSYYDGSNGNLRVVHCTSVDCQTFDGIIEVDGTRGQWTVGQYSSIAVPDDGIPIISYYDATFADLRVARLAGIIP